MSTLTTKAKILLDNSHFKKGLDDAQEAGSKFGSALKTTFKATAVAVGAITTAISAVAKQAVEEYSEFEQLKGGVETLFGAQGLSLEEYAKQEGKTVAQVKKEYETLQKSQEMVMDNAAKAYETAGLSANDYMETVTSFSASLLQSVGGDTVKAAEKADKAIVDMSDNANKMGTSMESIQNAYQGFAKQNYTMLDNLKLGYGGTKEEMERLVADAEKLDSSFKATRDENGDIAMSYADIVDAIHIVQDNIGITGTTAKEASTTIQGSLNSAKAAWTNLLTGLADEDADIQQLATNLVTTVTTAASNIIPTFLQVLDTIPSALTQIVDVIVDYLPTLITDLVPKLVTAVTGIIQALIDAMPQILNAVLKVAPQIFEAALMLITALAQGLADNLPELIPTIVDMILQMVTVLYENIPLLMDAARELIFGLILGLWDAKDDLLTAIGGLFMSMLRAIWSFFGMDSGESNTMAEIGAEIIDGLWQGIADKYVWLVDKISGFFNGITSKIKDFFGIASPSKLFEDQVGKNLALGIGVGFTTNMDEVEDEMQNALPTSLDVAAGVTTTVGSSPLSDGIDELIAMFKYGTAKTSVENTRDLRRAVNA